MTMIHYYVSGNTAEGFQNKLASNVDNMKHTFFLSHPSNTLKTMILNHIIDTYESSFDLEVFPSRWGDQYIEGVIIRGKSVAVLDSTLDTGNFPEAQRIDLEVAFDENNKNVDDLWNMMPQVNELTTKAYKQFETALKIHDDLEAIYIQEMDFNRADQLIEQLISEQVNNIPMEQKTSQIYHRMFGTNTPDGVVNVVSELIRPISKRYILKGRAGTGKSFFMKKVAKACEDRGLDLELYHCSFDPSSIDMVLVRNDFCIMDGTPPHERYPERASDVVIDLYDKTVTPGTDEKYAVEIEKVTKAYKTHMKNGLALLKEVGEIQSKIEANYIQTIPEEMRRKVITSVVKYIE